MNDVLFSEDALRQAAASVRRALLDSLPAPSQCTHEFSPEFQRKCKRLISRERRRGSARTIAKRAAMFFLAALASVSVWLSVDAGAREAFFSWVRDVYTGAHIYRFFGEPAADTLPVYRLSWIPEGYEEEEVYHDGEIFAVFYLCGEDISHSFEFRYFFAQHDRYIGILTEETDHVSLDINGVEADLYQARDPDTMSCLILMDEDAGIVFQIEGVLERSALLHMAESIVLTDSTG